MARDFFLQPGICMARSLLVTSARVWTFKHLSFGSLFAIARVDANWRAALGWPFTSEKSDALLLAAF